MPGICVYKHQFSLCPGKHLILHEPITKRALCRTCRIKTLQTISSEHFDTKWCRRRFPAQTHHAMTAKRGNADQVPTRSRILLKQHRNERGRQDIIRRKWTSLPVSSVGNNKLYLDCDNLHLTPALQSIRLQTLSRKKGGRLGGRTLRSQQATTTFRGLTRTPRLVQKRMNGWMPRLSPCANLSYHSQTTNGLVMRDKYTLVVLGQ